MQADAKPRTPAPAGANSLLQANSSVRFVHSHGRGRAIQPTRSTPESDTKLAAKIASPIHTDHQSSVLNMPLCQRRFVVMRRLCAAASAACSCSSGRDTDATNAAATSCRRSSLTSTGAASCASCVSISASRPRSSRCARSTPSPRARQRLLVVREHELARAHGRMNRATSQPSSTNPNKPDGDAAEHERRFPALPRLGRARQCIFAWRRLRRPIVRHADFPRSRNLRCVA